MKSQKGQIVTVLTIIALGVMTMGVFVGQKAVNKNPSSPFFSEAEENCISFKGGTWKQTTYQENYTLYTYLCNISDGPTQISSWVFDKDSNFFSASGGTGVQTLDVWENDLNKCIPLTFEFTLLGWDEQAGTGKVAKATIVATSRNVGDWGCHKDLKQVVEFGTAEPAATNTPTPTDEPDVTNTPTPTATPIPGQATVTMDANCEEITADVVNNSLDLIQLKTVWKAEDNAGSLVNEVSRVTSVEPETAQEILLEWQSVNRLDEDNLTITMKAWNDEDPSKIYFNQPKSLDCGVGATATPTPPDQICCCGYDNCTACDWLDETGCQMAGDFVCADSYCTTPTNTPTPTEEPTDYSWTSNGTIEEKDGASVDFSGFSVHYQIGENGPSGDVNFPANGVINGFVDPLGPDYLGPAKYTLVMPSGWEIVSESCHTSGANSSCNNDNTISLEVAYNAVINYGWKVKSTCQAPSLSWALNGVWQDPWTGGWCAVQTWFESNGQSFKVEIWPKADGPGSGRKKSKTFTRQQIADGEVDHSRIDSQGRFNVQFLGIDKDHGYTYNEIWIAKVTAFSDDKFTTACSKSIPNKEWGMESSCYGDGEPPAATATPVPDCKEDDTGAYNAACCCTSADCPTNASGYHQKCNIDNGYCKSNKSCNPDEYETPGTPTATPTPTAIPTPTPTITPQCETSPINGNCYNGNCTNITQNHVNIGNYGCSQTYGAGYHCCAIQTTTPVPTWTPTPTKTPTPSPTKTPTPTPTLTLIPGCGQPSYTWIRSCGPYCPYPDIQCSSLEQCRWTTYSVPGCNTVYDCIPHEDCVAPTATPTPTPIPGCVEKNCQDYDVNWPNKTVWYADSLEIGAPTLYRDNACSDPINNNTELEAFCTGISLKACNELCQGDSECSTGHCYPDPVTMGATSICRNLNCLSDDDCVCPVGAPTPTPWKTCNQQCTGDRECITTRCYTDPATFIDVCRNPNCLLDDDCVCPVGTPCTTHEECGFNGCNPPSRYCLNWEKCVDYFCDVDDCNYIIYSDTGLHTCKHGSHSQNGLCCPLTETDCAAYCSGAGAGLPAGQVTTAMVDAAGDGNGFVNAKDLEITIRNAFTSVTPGTNGDNDFNGMPNGRDYSIGLMHIGKAVCPSDECEDMDSTVRCENYCFAPKECTGPENRCCCPPPPTD